jgi:hypothetical protein
MYLGFLNHYPSTNKPTSYTSESQGILQRGDGIAKYKGDCVTFLVLDSVDLQVVACSEFHSAITSISSNLQKKSYIMAGSLNPNPFSPLQILLIYVIRQQIQKCLNFLLAEY